MTETIASAIERYLRDGSYETDHPAWPGNIWERTGHDDLLGALAKEVLRRSADRRQATDCGTGRDQDP